MWLRSLLLLLVRARRRRCCWLQLALHARWLGHPKLQGWLLLRRRPRLLRAHWQGQCEPSGGAGAHPPAQQLRCCWGQLALLLLLLPG
jgi:hypothetical protein